MFEDLSSRPGLFGVIGGAVIGLLSTEADSKKKGKGKGKKKRKKKHPHHQDGDGTGGGTTNDWGACISGETHLVPNYLIFSEAQAVRYGETIDELYQRGIVTAAAIEHIGAADVAHGTEYFAWWHEPFRWYLEKEGRKIDPNFAFAYVPWEQIGGPNHYIFQDKYLGPNGDPNQGNRVLTGHTKNWRPFEWDPASQSYKPDDNIGLIRELGRRGSLPTPGQINTLLAIPDRQTFLAALEGRAAGMARYHNDIHVWGGGTLSEMQSPMDLLLFMAIHAWVAWMLKRWFEIHNWDTSGLNLNVVPPKSRYGESIGTLLNRLKCHIIFA